MLPLAAFVFFGGENFYAACVVGCLAKVLYMKLKENINIEAWSYKLLSSLLLLICVILINIRNEIEINPTIAFGIQALSAAFIVLIVYTNNYKILSNRLLVWFGNISYEFYLVHFVVLLALRSYYYNSVSYILVCLAISIVISKVLNVGTTYLVKKIK